MSLNEDFRDFINSPESKKPAFRVREDWREWNREQAMLNGDTWQDENPDTSFDSNWAEPDFPVPDEDELEELVVFTKVSRREKLVGFGDDGGPESLE